MTADEQQREDELGISVVSEKMTVMYEQTIRLKDRTKIGSALSWIQMRLSRNGMTGQITSELQDGGCRRVTVTHVRNIPVGSPLQDAVESVFKRKV